jgi:nucleotide-binding universal stress UspA family protein
MGSCAHRSRWPEQQPCSRMPGTIVCGVTDCAEGRAAAQLAAALAARLDLRLVLAHGPTDRGGSAGVSAALGEIARESCHDVDVRVVEGNRVDALAQVAAEEGADVIVLGSRPRGARGRQLRCTFARDLEAAQTVPVVIAPPATRRRTGRRLALADAPAGR